MNTQERITVLKKEIEERETELRNLFNKLMDEETDIHKKFVAWANNGLDKETNEYLPSRGSAIRNWCDEHLDLGSMRGCVHLMEYDDSFGLFAMTDEEMKTDFGDYDSTDDINKLKQDPLFISACEQMIKDNMDSFEINW